MQLLKHQWVTDAYGLSALCITKSRGKINMDELVDYLRYDARLYSNWAVLLRATESTCDVGWPEEPRKGDEVLLYQIEEGEACPICRRLCPPKYCPHCGERFTEDSTD